jgi:23S rRNA G2445 N2-methylase RlmL
MKADQDLYKRLRELPREELWNGEVPRFNSASPRERMEQVAVIRAVGMIFSRFGTEEEKSTVRDWLIALLKDPQEKIRRYALAALPKIGAGEQGEREMLALLKSGAGEQGAREKKHLGRALEKIGGEATLAVIEQGIDLPAITVQKVKAVVSRKEESGGVLLDAPLPIDSDMRVLLCCRRGLEEFVGDEAKGLFSPAEWLLEKTTPGCVTLKPLKAFTLATLYRLRCFATVAFPLGTICGSEGPKWVESLARCIASERTRDLMLGGTEGAPRYRLEFAGRGHQRGAIRQVIDRAYALCPEILNDARQAPWSIDVIPTSTGESLVELRPRLYPDPRLGYRQEDIAAASHPPLAACMARLAGSEQNEEIWDPFCGSGLELIERSLLGGVAVAHGTDLDARAITVARANFEAAGLAGTTAEFTECDFRKSPIAPGSISLIITNPPLGRRVRIKDMQGLFSDLYASAARALKVGGRLVFVNPLRTEPTDTSLKLEYRKIVDLGGFNCRLELYRKVAPGSRLKTTLPSKAKQDPAASKKESPAAWWSRAGSVNKREKQRSSQNW